jgi:hypothetical protein
MKYRTKSTEVDAVLMTQGMKDGTEPLPPEVALCTCMKGIHQFGYAFRAEDPTGQVHGRIGDWLVKLPDGTLFFFNPDDFDKEYEPIEGVKP